MKSVEDCAGRAGYGSIVGYPMALVPELPKSFSISSSKPSEEEDIKEVTRMMSTSKRSISVRDNCNGTGYAGLLGRSNSIGLGRICRIDEDVCCDFEEKFTFSPKAKIG